MIDQQRHVFFQLRELGLEHFRREMPRRERDFRHLVRERDLREHGPKALFLVRLFPQEVGRARIARDEDGVPRSLFDDKTDRRHGMMDGVDIHGDGADVHEILDRTVAQDRAVAVRDVREVGPDLVVEEVLAEDIEDLEGRDELDRAAPKHEHVVGEETDVLDVVEVRVAQEDVVDVSLFFEGKGGGRGAGVEQDIVVEQEARGLITRSDAAVGAEHAQFQGESPILSNDRSSILEAVKNASTTFSQNWVPRFLAISAYASRALSAFR